MHGMRLPLDLLLVARAFELWVHDIDIRRAVGLPPSAPDASTLSLMTELRGRDAAARGRPDRRDEPISLHLVLTGPGGGTWDLPIGEGLDALPTTIVTDAVGFCHLVGNRAAPDELDLYITGD